MREYLQILIFTMLFVVVIEMIFPNSDLRKYIKLVLACVVIYTLFTPILKLDLFAGGSQYNEYVNYYSDQLGIEIEGEQAYYLQEYEQKFLEAYKEQEEEKIIQKLEGEMNLTVEEVNVEIDNDKYVPEVSGIELVVSEGKRDLDEESDEGVSTIYIPKIKIGDKTDNNDLNPDNLKKDIKNCLGNFYNWDKVNIYIIVQDNEMREE